MVKISPIADLRDVPVPEILILAVVHRSSGLAVHKALSWKFWLVYSGSVLRMV